MSSLQYLMQTDINFYRSFQISASLTCKKVHTSLTTGNVLKYLKCGPRVSEFQAVNNRCPLVISHANLIGAFSFGKIIDFLVENGENCLFRSQFYITNICTKYFKSKYAHLHEKSMR